VRRDEPCHTFKEVLPGLWLGKASQVEAALGPDGPVDVLVPLASLGGSVWGTGWRGGILYYPVTDFSVLPKDVLARCVDDVLARLGAGKRVAVFCVGGHGRTGYVGAAVIGRLRPDLDPIAFLRENYCRKAVETVEQVNAVAEYLGRPELKEHAPAEAHSVAACGGDAVASWTSWDDWDVYAGGSGYDYSSRRICYWCAHFDIGTDMCLWANRREAWNATACKHFKDVRRDAGGTERTKEEKRAEEGEERRCGLCLYYDAKQGLCWLDGGQCEATHSCDQFEPLA
jgi:hypothetical protein